MICIVSCKRNCQVITKSSVYQIDLFFCLSNFQFFPSLQNLENQFFIVATLFAAQVLNVFHTRCLYGSKSKCLIGILDHLDHIISDFHFFREHVFHAGNRFFL